MEPEAPWAVDQAIKSRTGNGAPAGLGTVMPDIGQHRSERRVFGFGCL